MSHDETQPVLPKPEARDENIVVPEKIGRYRIEGLMEKGGMSLLYLGSHPETNEPIIVKVLLSKYVSNPEVAARFLNEAHIISLADHPNIIKLYDYGEWEGGLYIAMEFIQGTSLRKALSHQPFSLRKALEVILQIAYALCHLHTHGVIHGDLKPENILVTDQGVVKVIDFGIAKVLTEMANEEKMRGQGRLIGTPIYMSPEARENFQTTTFQSDIYSLGIIAYELAIGKITHGKLILSLAPRGMQKILNKALQPNLEDRYQDIVDFISDISNYMNSSEVEKDRQGSDYFFELYERMERFQSTLIPIEAPFWKGIEIGLGHIFGMGLNGIYYEFFELSPTKKAIFAAEVPMKGAEGVFFTSMLRSILRTLIKTDSFHPKKLFQQVLDRIREDAASAEFHLAFLTIDTETNHYEYHTTGYGLLLHHSASTGQSTFINQSREVKSTFSKNDRLLFVGYIGQEKLFEEAFRQTLSLAPQKQIEGILRKMRVRSSALNDEHPLLLVALSF